MRLSRTSSASDALYYTLSTLPTKSDAVVDRLPQRPATDYREGEEVHLFTRFDNPGERRRTVRHRWYHEGKRKSSIELSVRGRTWRTWSSVPVYGKGAWRVDVVDEADTVLRSLEFTVR